MPIARKPVFRNKRNSSRHPDRVQVWNDVLRSLNPATRAEYEREKRLHKLMSDILDSEVGPDSPFLQIIQRIGDRWSPLILSILSSGTFRHSELQRVINVFSDMSDMTHISQRILTLKLRTLERDGLLTRKIWPTIPPRTDYTLTPLGLSLTKWLLELMDWSGRASEQILEAQKQYDRLHADK